MDIEFTTHLICAPQGELGLSVKTILARTREIVEVDQPLVLLSDETKEVWVCAPEKGVIGEWIIGEGEAVQPGDLLLTMEIQEKPFGFLELEKKAESPVTAPSSFTHSLKVELEAEQLADLLGVDLSEIPTHSRNIIDKEAVAAYVRDILIRWRKLKRLLTS